MIKPLVTTVLLLGLSACAYPQTTVQQGSSQSSIYVLAPAEGVYLWVDGVEVGSAVTFKDKKHSYSLAAGRHHIELKTRSGSVFDKEIYVETGATIAVGATQ